MRRSTWLWIFILLLSSVRSVPVSAASSLYNDPHGQWSLIFLDSYKVVDAQYHIGPTEQPGFSGSVSLQSASDIIVSVRYYECCPADPARLPRFAQQDFDKERQSRPDVTMAADGILATTLAGQPAARFDFTETNNGAFIHGREIIAQSGGLVYAVAFLGSG